MSTPPSPLADRSPLLAKVANSFLAFILDNNSFEGTVILLITPRSFNTLIGSVEIAKQVQEAIVRRWITAAKAYGYTESIDCFTPSTCLLIAVLQSLVGFQGTTNGEPEQDTVSLGQAFAKLWGKKTYSTGWAGQTYFNPSKQPPDSELSFQYQLWTYLQNYFADTYGLHLYVPKPKSNRDRYLQFVKAQVPLTYPDIQEISALLNESVDFYTAPSEDTVHHLIFSHWRKVSDGFAPRLREIIQKSSGDGQLERFYSRIIARYYDTNARQDLHEISSQHSGKNFPSGPGQQQLRLEFNQGVLKLVLFDLRHQSFSKFSNRATLEEFFHKSPDRLLLFYKEDPNRISEEYAMCETLVPTGRKIMVLAMLDALPPGDHWTTSWKDQRVLGLRVCYRVFINVDELPIQVLRHRQVINESRLPLIGGLKHPRARNLYLEGAGPRIPPCIAVQKVGYGPLERYTEHEVTAGRYLAGQVSFDVSPVEPAPRDLSTFGFDLSCWTYSSKADEINLAGLETTNSLPPPVTRQWINQQLAQRTSVAPPLSS